MSRQQACARCAALQAENRRLQAQVKRLEERIRRILAAVKNAAAAAAGIDDEAAKRMEAGGLPRAAWSYLKGTRATARALARKLAQAMLQ